MRMPTCVDLLKILMGQPKYYGERCINIGWNHRYFSIIGARVRVPPPQAYDPLLISHFRTINKFGCISYTISYASFGWFPVLLPTNRNSPSSTVCVTFVLTAAVPCLLRCSLLPCTVWTEFCFRLHARLVRRLSKFSSITAYMRDVLHWLPSLSLRGCRQYRITAMISRCVLRRTIATSTVPIVGFSNSIIDLVATYRLTYSHWRRLGVDLSKILGARGLDNRR